MVLDHKGIMGCCEMLGLYRESSLCASHTLSCIVVHTEGIGQKGAVLDSNLHTSWGLEFK